MGRKNRQEQTRVGKSEVICLVKVTPGVDAIKGILIKHGANKYSQSEWTSIADFPILKDRLKSEAYILSEKEDAITDENQVIEITEKESTETDGD